MDEEKIDAPEYREEEADNGFLRWISVAVVCVAIAGFFALAWYAYHTGSAESVKEEELATVEADASPMKEAPADPGGMEFPHQDKTVYDTIASGNPSKPAAERVLPAPEEPVRLDEPKTQTWVYSSDTESAGTSGQNLKVYQSEEVMSKTPRVEPKISADSSVSLEAKAGDAASNKNPQTKENAPPIPPVVSTVLPATPSVEVESVPVATKARSALSEIRKEAKKLSVAPMLKVPEKKSESSSSSGARVQIGAFKSEAEARTQLAKISQKHAAVASKKEAIARADLGAKGVFYRLQLTGFTTAAEAKSFCASLSAKGQGCFVVSQ